MTSRARRASSSGSGSSSKRFSRPRRTPRTRPASCNTRRCFVIAWRVSVEPSVRRAIETRDPRLSFVRSFSRVASPRAANIGAFLRRSRPPLSRLAGDMGLDVLHLLGPAAAVHPERLIAPRRRARVESRLRDDQHRSRRRLFEPELDQRGRLLPVVLLRIHGLPSPRDGELPLRHHLLDLDLHGHVLVAREVEVRSEEHTSELQSLTNIVCRLLLEKKKTATAKNPSTHSTG